MAPRLVGLNELANIQNKVNFIIGSARTGKTSFLKQILSSIKPTNVFIFMKDQMEWKTTTKTSYHTIQCFVTQNPFETPIMKDKQIPSNSVIIFDDYIHLFLSKTEHLAQFQNLIYVEASHSNLTIFFGIQSTLKNNLRSYILGANYIFLTYCASNKTFLKLFFPVLSQTYITHFPVGVKQYDIALVDTRQEYFFPSFNRLLINKSVTVPDNCIPNMFDPDHKFYLLRSDEFSLYTKDADNENTETHATHNRSNDPVDIGDATRIDATKILDDISFHGKKKLKPTTMALATKLVKFTQQHNILFSDSDSHYFLRLPRSEMVVFLIDILSIFQSTTKNNQTMDSNSTETSLLPEIIEIIAFLRKHKFRASRGLIHNKEVYGRLMYPETKCTVFWKHQNCLGNHREHYDKIRHDQDYSNDTMGQHMSNVTIIDY